MGARRLSVSLRLTLLLAVGALSFVLVQPAAAAGVAPTGVTAASLDSKVDLNWQPVAGATAYNVYRGLSATTVTTLVSPVGGIPLPGFTDATVVNGTAYFYAVRAVSVGSESANSLVAQATPVARSCATGNAIVLENCYPGGTGWKLTGATTVAAGGIEGFGTAASIDRGGSVGLKVNATAGSTFRVEIWRTGSYGGSGGRLLSTLRGNAGIAQPACASDSTTGLLDCANWTTNATITTSSSWPTGVYLLRLVREDTGKDNQILLIVRDDSRQSDVLYGVSVSTFEAYNNFGGKSLYDFNSSGAVTVGASARAVKVSLNRPFEQPRSGQRDWYTFDEIATVAWLERSGYDVSYASNTDLDATPSLATGHKAYISPAHDEYWSAGMRSAVTAARDAGVGLFFSGSNEVYWKIRFENGGRTEVCYKTVQAGAADPVTPTTTWRDPSGPNQPENGLTGEMYIGDNDFTYFPFVVSAAQGTDRLFRYTGLDAQVPGTSTSIGQSLVGWEWDARVANGAEPAGVKVLGGSPVTGELVQGNGASYLQNQQATTQMVKYAASSGALVVTTGTNHWNRGLGLNVDGAGEPDVRIRQITTNILADMAAYPRTPAADITVDDPNAPKPPSPTGAAATVSGGDSALVSWSPVAGAAGYNVYRTVTPRQGGFPLGAKINGTPVTGTSFTDTGLTPTTTYYYVVTSVAGGTQSDPSNEASVTTPVATAQAIRINTGGGAYTSLSGATYKADTNFAGGSTYQSTSSITGTADAALYQNERWGNFSYAIPVPNGVYDVRFHFVELYYGVAVPGGVGKRVFSMDIGNTSLSPDLKNLDIYAAVGANAAYDRTVSGVSVTTGTLNIQSVYGAADDPEVAAIELIPTVTGPPTVTSTTPAAGATAVPTTVQPTATFSRGMDATTITSTSFTLSRADGTPVPATVSYDASTSQATIVASGPLAASSGYTAQLATTVKAADGKPLAAPVSWSFTTGTPTPPSVSSTIPSNGATNVATNVAPSATFSRAMDATTVTGSSFTLTKSDGTVVNGAVTYAAGTNVATLTPSAALAYSTTYTARLDTTIKGADGVALAAPVSWTLTTQAPPPPPGSGLAAAYGFNEGAGTTAADASGNNNTGTLVNAAWSTAGKYGKALTFNGTNAYVTIPDSASLHLTTGMTLEAWVNPTTLGSAWRTVILKERPADLVWGLYANSSSGKPEADVATPADSLLTGSTALGLNTWSHLAATYDGATLRIFVNGTQVASRAQTGALLTSTGLLKIGGNAIWGEYFSGLIDEVRIYNRALSATELQTDMAAAVGGGGTPADTTAPTVSVTAPAAGATVTGAATVTASAADNVGVVGVQFNLDGAQLGAEDTAAPYSIGWDTTQVMNGTHTLTAVARDAAGNTTTSTAVTVTVANSGSPDQIGTWSATMNWGLVAVHMSLLPTGNVLMFDGFAAAPNSETIFNPVSGAFTPVPYGRNLFCAGHVLLPDGRTLIVGGHVAADVGLADTTGFNTTTNTWTRYPDMTVARWYPTATVMGDGRVFVLAGDNIVQNRTGQPTYLTDASVNSLPEVFDPVTNTWTDLTNSKLTTPLYPFLFQLPDGRLLDAGPDTTTRVITPGQWTWQTIGTSPFDGMSAVMYRPGKIMKSGSWADPDFNGSLTYQSINATAVLDMTQPSPAWRSTSPMAFPRAYQNLTMLPDGTVLASGGMTTSDGTDLTKGVLPAEIWNPTTETWTTVASMSVPREYHSTAMLLPDGRVLMAGGGQLPGSPAVNETNAQIYSPPYLFKGARPTITSAPQQLTYSSNFTVTTPDAASIQSVALIRTPSVTHAFDQNQRYIPLTFTKGSGTLDVTTPVDGNTAPPGYYMLFIVNANGVPSVSTFVRFPAPWEDLTPPSTPTGVTATGGLASVTLNWTAATDNVGVVKYDVYRGTASGFAVDAAHRIAQPTGTTYTDSGLAAGTYFYVVKAEDAAANLSAASSQVSAAATSDTTAPTVSLTAPAAGATVSGSATLTATASDNVAVAGVTFRVDGVALGSEDTTAPYSAAWDTTTASNGTHTLTAVARDTSNLTTTSTTVSVTVSNAAPPPPIFLFGDQTIESFGDFNNAGIAEAYKSTATTAGTLRSIKIYVDAGSTATKLVVGVYSDAAGHPGTLLAQGSVAPPLAGAWNDIALPTAAITSGSAYWIAILGPTGSGTIKFRDRCCGGGQPAETSFSASLATLPATWQTGTLYSDGPASAYGVG